jgi:hypothetical protein
VAEKLLIMGESGTGKSTSLRNCDPETTAVVNPVGKPLPFKGSGKFTMLNGETDARKICKWMKDQAAAGKKLIVVDDFQYVLAVPYMKRIKESGWDKYNDFGANYFDIIQVCNELPADVVIAYMTHLETLDTGLTTVKLIGKLLREKITIEGLFTTVLRTGVNEGKYYFFTQNSGKDTVKSPMGMFQAYAIDNDLNYVVDKLRNYYEIGTFKSDAEMAEEDAANSHEDVQQSGGRRSRAKTAAEVRESNKEKRDEYMAAVGKVVEDAAGDQEAVPFEEVAPAVEAIPQPEQEPIPQRSRKNRPVLPQGHTEEVSPAAEAVMPQRRRRRV